MGCAGFQFGSDNNLIGTESLNVCNDNDVVNICNINECVNDSIDNEYRANKLGMMMMMIRYMSTSVKVNSVNVPSMKQILNVRRVSEVGYFVLVT